MCDIFGGSEYDTILPSVRSPAVSHRFWVLARDHVPKRHEGLSHEASIIVPNDEKFALHDLVSLLEITLRELFCEPWDVLRHELVVLVDLPL